LPLRIPVGIVAGVGLDVTLEDVFVDSIANFRWETEEWRGVLVHFGAGGTLVPLISRILIYLRDRTIILLKLSGLIWYDDWRS
jgi:hypothetical protein